MKCIAQTNCLQESLRRDLRSVLRQLVAYLAPPKLFRPGFRFSTRQRTESSTKWEVVNRSLDSRHSSSGSSSQFRLRSCACPLHHLNTPGIPRARSSAQGCLICLSLTLYLHTTYDEKIASRRTRVLKLSHRVLIGLMSFSFTTRRAFLQITWK